MKGYSQITYRYLKVQKRRTILTILGIVLSVALITSIGTMVVSMRDKMIRDVTKSTGDYYAAFMGVPADKIVRIKNNINVNNIALSMNDGTALLALLSNTEREGSRSTKVTQTYFNMLI